MAPHTPGGILFQEILEARQRVYMVGEPTPLERITVPGGSHVHLKREDLSPIHAYKWRGAYNRMAMLKAAEYEAGVVAASAGNHAQGVALAAKRLGVHATIYMPMSTPRMKQVAVERHGGDAVRVMLVGDTYDDAAAAARDYCQEQGSTFVHPYNDYAVMGGQGTLADEVVMSGQGPFDVAYLQIGGGGMAAAVSSWLKHFYPGIRIVGVEGVDQASMAAACKAGGPVELDYVDVFCDGTAVRKVGDLTYGVCRETIDEYVTVTNEEVCAAVQTLWETRRVIPEPSGAMGLAACLKDTGRAPDARTLCVVCGANMDFGQLAWIARHAGIGAARRRYYRFHLGEKSGELLRLLEDHLSGLNIVEFQYGKVSEAEAWPVIGVEASPPEIAAVEERFREYFVEFEVVTSEEDVEFRIINYEPALFKPHPLFIKFQFPERAGALHDFLVMLGAHTNICYFNYVFTGETVGRAMLGLEFDSEDDRAAMIQSLENSHWTYDVIADEVLGRIL